jgi:outer membrane immunogenic protein
MFRTLLISTVSSIALATTAFAADLPSTKGPPAYVPPPPLVISWTGFYVGVNAGGAWGNLDHQTSTAYSTAGYFLPTDVLAVNATGHPDNQASGFTGGGQIGYNYQVSPFAVVGVETDFDYLHLHVNSSGSGVYPCCAPSSFAINSSSTINWLWTLRPRVGFLVMPNLLIYATGGLALSQASSSFQFTDDYSGGAAASGSLSGTRVGWTIGGGAEYALTQNWSIKAEYLYADLGRRAVDSNNLVAYGGASTFPASVFTHDIDPRVNIARVGLNYRFDPFGPPAPVVAKY